MKTLFRLILLVIVLGGWALAALSLHVVRLPDTEQIVGGVPKLIGIIPKNRLHWVDTYLDVRTWTPADVALHPDFIRRLNASEKAGWLTHAVPDPKGDVEIQLLDILENGPPATQPSETQTTHNRPKAPLSPRFNGVK